MDRKKKKVFTKHSNGQHDWIKLIDAVAKLIFSNAGSLDNAEYPFIAIAMVWFLGLMAYQSSRVI